MNMNKYYAIAYKLYTVCNGEKTFEEEAPANDPFIFITGFGTTIPGFEKHLEGLEEGQTFDFTLSKDEAYGEYYEERVIELDKSIFEINGRFDSAHIFVDAIVPLHNEDGNRFNGRVLAITEDKVRVDLNYPLAGKELNFVGEVVKCHEASNEEIQSLLNSLSGCGCHGGCGSCHGDCGGGGCSGDGCNGDCGK